MWLSLFAGLFAFLQLRQLESLSLSYPDMEDDDITSVPIEGISRSSRSEKSDEMDTKIDGPSSISPLDSYYYALDPIIPPSVYEPRSSNPLPTVLVGSQVSMDGNNGWILDGVLRSRYLQLVQSFIFNAETRIAKAWLHETNVDTDLPTVYLVDWEGLGRDCYLLETLLAGADSIQSNSFLVYLDTTASTRITTCSGMERLFEKSHVRIAKRSIVSGRHWNATKPWVETGQIVGNSGTQHSGGSVLFSPHVLRETFVGNLSSILGSTPSTKSTVYSSRSTDVSHFWRKGDYSHYGFLRYEVSNIVTARTSRTLNRIRGDEDGIEKGFVQREYIEFLLKSKIVVVAQNDEWEDHYRLFESMASGALVFTDVILALPHGLRNRTNIVVYDSRSSLRRQLAYYLDPQNKEERLTIARRGWKYVMGKHRSWHRLECLLFGMARTLANKPEDPAPTRI